MKVFSKTIYLCCLKLTIKVDHWQNAETFCHAIAWRLLMSRKITGRANQIVYSLLLNHLQRYSCGKVSWSTFNLFQENFPLCSQMSHHYIYGMADNVKGDFHWRNQLFTQIIIFSHCDNELRNLICTISLHRQSF